jgi:hypothetical protein
MREAPGSIPSTTKKKKEKRENFIKISNKMVWV